MQAISMGCLCYRQQEWMSCAELTDGERITLGHIIMTGRGKSTAYPSMQYLRELAGTPGHPLSLRTIQKRVQGLVDKGFIAVGRIRTKETERKGFAILPHPALVAWAKELAAKFKTPVRVVIQNISGIFCPSGRSQKTNECAQNANESAHPSNYIEERKKNEVSPPCPPRGGAAADAAEVGGMMAAPVTASKASVEEAPQPAATGEKPVPDTGNQLWLAALALLEAAIPANEYQLWLKPVQAIGDTQSLQLICDNKFVCAWIQEHYGKALKKVMNEIGVQQYRLTSETSLPALTKQENEKALQKKKIAEDTERQRIDSLPMREQFSTLLSVYPRKDENRGQGRAFKLFNKLVREKMISSTYDLMVFINNQKMSEDWKKKNGQYIPSLYNWLSNMPWVNFLINCQPV